MEIRVECATQVVKFPATDPLDAWRLFIGSFSVAQHYAMLRIEKAGVYKTMTKLITLRYFSTKGYFLKRAAFV